MEDVRQEAFFFLGSVLDRVHRTNFLDLGQLLALFFQRHRHTRVDGCQNARRRLSNMFLDWSFLRGETLGRRWFRLRRGRGHGSLLLVVALRDGRRGGFVGRPHFLRFGLARGRFCFRLVRRTFVDRLGSDDGVVDDAATSKQD